MSRARPAVVAVLLVVASATAALAVSGSVSAPVQPSDDPVVATSENSTRVLLLTEADAAEFSQPTASVTDTLDSGYAELSTDLRFKQVEQRLEAAETPAEKRQVLENATRTAERRLESLQTREQAARSQFASGQITSREFLFEISTIHAEATRLVSTIGRSTSEGTLYDYAGTLTEDTDVRPRLSRVRTQLAGLEGPVRERVAAVVHGDRDAIRVHVTVGDGLMLSTIDGGEYVRETYRPDNLADETADYGDARGLVNSLYPWIEQITPESSLTLSANYAIIYNVNHPHGQLAVWVNAATERVYVERQEVVLSQLPADAEVTHTTNNTTLSTSRTYAGGPLLVQVQNASGAPVDATISLDGLEVGETDNDGRLWLLSPAGDYTITADPADGPTLQANVSAPPKP